MNPRRYPELQACLDELRSGGATQIDVRQGKHFVVTAIYKGRLIKTVVARSASDHRAVQNCRTHVRRQIRQAEIKTTLTS